MQIQLQNKVCTPPLLARLLTPSTHSIKKIRNHHWLASVTLLYLLPQINCVTEKYNIVELDLVQQTSLHSPLGGRKNWAPGRWRGMLGFIKRVTREAHIQTPGLPASSPLPASTTQLPLGHFCLPQALTVNDKSTCGLNAEQTYHLAKYLLSPSLPWGADEFQQQTGQRAGQGRHVQEAGPREKQQVCMPLERPRSNPWSKV